MNTHSINFGIFLACTVIFAGCTSSLSPITITLTDLGTASKSEHSMTGLRVMRTVNITGLGPNEVVGSISVDPDPPNPLLDFPSPFSSKDYPDSLGFRLSPNCSRVAEMTFKDEVTIQDITAIRDGVQEIATLVSRKLHFEVRKAVLEEAVSFLAKTNDAEKKSTYLKSIQNVFPEYDLADEEKLKAVISNVDTMWQAISNVVDSKRTELKTALQKPGIITTRWSVEKKRSGSLEAVGTGTQASKTTNQEGFLVLGNPRVVTLILGSDVVARAQRSDPKSGKCELTAECIIEVKNLIKPTRSYMTYYQLSAKHLAWGETSSGASSFAIQADISKIIRTLNPLIKAGSGIQSILEQFQVKAAAEFSKAYELGNSGFNSGGNTKIYPFRFSNHENFLKSLSAQQKRGNSYRPIYNARATIDRFIDYHKNSKWAVTDANKCADKSDINFDIED